MRKILCLVMAVVMALALVACATAEESGVQVTEKSIGEGATTFGVFVQLATTEDQATLYHVSTDETTLLAALTNVALVAGKEAAWGFNVTTVDGIRPIMTIRASIGAFLPMMTRKDTFRWKLPSGIHPLRQMPFTCFT